ncbi:rod-binding protein [Peteryoungia desertarenae]|uniref:Rod-binding protein n=1 Tax=Peteryoungia desertarenae TaxID=1813451 RepID=A0ABX6QLH1_9HYPH|nr:rod-binding protein [Peteryoungia desertarenae]QLF69389.1 rod-binding protein [Peteryoungia desertarenae]
MAISPPSDLVLDVVRAADPQQVAVAQEKMKASRAQFMATNLAEKGAGFGAAVDILKDVQSTEAGLGNLNVRQGGTVETPKVYREFEAVFLSNFVKSMMPEDSEEVYGKGNAGEMWKSMMAEQLGSVIAESGGVGVAEQMYRDALARQRGGTEINASTNENDRSMAISMIHDLERRTLGVASADDQKN